MFSPVIEFPFMEQVFFATLALVMLGAIIGGYFRRFRLFQFSTAALILPILYREILLFIDPIPIELTRNYLVAYIIFGIPILLAAHVVWLVSYVVGGVMRKK